MRCSHGRLHEWHPLRCAVHAAKPYAVVLLKFEVAKYDRSSCGRVRQEVGRILGKQK
jgi:hypothetical protein